MNVAASRGLLSKGLNVPEHPSAIEQVKDAAQH